jgi:Fur family ferric uptake transcriptional regulator
MSFVEEASAAIRESGGRFTSQRRLIAELLEDANEHLDAESLYHMAYERDTSVSLATVYRTLSMLKDAGLIEQRYFARDHGREYYEPVTAHEHYHFTCRNCHQIVEFESDLVDQIRQVLEGTVGVSVKHACVCFEGLCEDCKNAER